MPIPDELIAHNYEMAHQINMIKNGTPPKFKFWKGKQNLDCLGSYEETLVHSMKINVHNAGGGGGDDDDDDDNGDKEDGDDSLPTWLTKYLSDWLTDRFMYLPTDKLTDKLTDND